MCGTSRIDVKRDRVDERVVVVVVSRVEDEGERERSFEVTYSCLQLNTFAVHVFQEQLHTIRATVPCRFVQCGLSFLHPIIKRAETD